MSGLNWFAFHFHGSCVYVSEEEKNITDNLGHLIDGALVPQRLPAVIQF